MIKQCRIIFVYHIRYEKDKLAFLVTKESHREKLFFSNFFLRKWGDSEGGEGSGQDSGNRGGLDSGGEGV